ncbi:L-arabinose 1-dehydrogenase [Aquimixticola soesokkakensis]|uniref:L-arabinose 1-dehydrogenase n=1 Tax=Aquimixticola soesokkakensis TaxID=1519096 RepID=A0A1Y5RL44_9RHOB|nr:Gfo/Idh/MocA family oxidoreductase [Aquimixticola soesokkakensis]SLN19703.1 L-arabinose 1-dehydrogenase [Aquimixticola soesokkakensis]
MSKVQRIGLIGCGNISQSYLSRAKNFKNITFTAVADINLDAAKARGAEFDVPAMSVDDLMASDTVDIVLNLTIPAAHFGISKQALESGKHVYSEKPYVLTLEEGRALKALADEKGLRVGSAPDTVLGGSHQLARHLIDTGAVGTITSGTCAVMSHGMEDWHPNPDFFFVPGGGPILDLGPYYIANLVQLIGPVKRVGAITSTPSKTRTIGNGPRTGEEIPVTTPTTIHATLEFEQGAVVTLVASWDVWQNDLAPMALYGTEGTLHVPDPNFFGGALRLTNRAETAELPDWDHPLGVDNREVPWGMAADYRTTGLADMAQAIAQNRPHRCNDAYALHVVEVMTAILKSGEEGKYLTLTTTCERPDALGIKAAQELLA